MKRIKEKKEIFCDNCDKIFEKWIHPDPLKNSKFHYCSRTCANKGFSISGKWSDERKQSQSISMSGTGNGNYGKKWSSEKKEIASENRKKMFSDNPDYAYACGKTNRGVKFDSDRINKMHGHRSKESYSRPHSDKTKRIIGEKSSEKWTTEYRKIHRHKMEELGIWISREFKNPYRNYYKDSNWIKNIEKFISENKLIDFKQYGLFSKINKTGLVRDHIFDRRTGWDLKIPSYILQHPANLQFISHSENIKKGFIDRNLSIENKKEKLKELLIKIQDICYNEYPLQQLCLNYILIENYE